MSAIRTLIEFAAICLLIYGFIHEDNLIAFEQNIKRIIFGSIRRAIRIRNERREKDEINRHSEIFY